jgi:hypothetical protein
MDVVDLQSGLAFGTSMEEIADFLTRDVEEVREKAAAFRRTDSPAPLRF